MEDGARILQDCYDYHFTVGFFVVLTEKLTDLGIRHEVERDFLTSDGETKTPDFVVFDGDEMTDVLEHKASLSGPKGALDEAKSIAAKYKLLMHEREKSAPQVTLLYPIKKQETMDEVADELPDGLTLCSFDQETSHTELRFKLKGPVRSKPLRLLLQGDPIVFNPSISLSKYKYIKAGPPVTYTAADVWTLLPIFRGIQDVGRPSFEVDRGLLIERAKSFYPPWIRDNNQVTTARVDDALEFLDLIDFIDWKPGRSKIIIYTNKGSRSGEVLAYFAERMAKIRAKQARRRGRVAYAKGQTSLFDRPWR